MRYLGASVSSIDSLEKWERFKGAFNAGVQMTFWRSLVAGGGPGQYDSAVVSSTRYMIERMANELRLVAGHPVLYELTEAMPTGTVTDRHRSDHLRWWVDTFGRFVYVTDVVNEPFHCPLTDWRAYYERIKTLAPHIRTRFNEFDILNGAGTRAIRDFVRPHLDVIDVIGIQAHYLHPLRNGRLPSIDTVRRNLDIMAEMGKPTHITEISIPSARGGWTERLQAQWLDQLLGVFNTHPAVEAAFYWDLGDANAWNPTSGLWRADGTVKPAWGTVLKYVQK